MSIVAHHLVFLRPKFVGTGVVAELKTAWFCTAERRQEIVFFSPRRLAAGKCKVQGKDALHQKGSQPTGAWCPVGHEC